MFKEFLKKSGWKYLPGFILLLSCAWLQTRLPLTLGESVELALQGEWEPFIHSALMLLFFALAVFVTRFAWRWFLILPSRDLEVHIRDSLYTHLLNLPADFFTQARSGDLMAYAINDVNAVRMLSGMVFAQAVNSLSSLIFSVAEMGSSIDLTLTAYAMIPVPFALVTVILLGNTIRRKAKYAQEMFSKISAHVQENINGMRVIKAFALEDNQYKAYEEESLEKQRANIDWYYTSHYMEPAIKVLFGVSFAVGLVLGGQMVIDGKLTLAKYIAFNSYLTMIVNPINMLGRVNVNLQKGLASYARLNSIMKLPEIPVSERAVEKAPLIPSVQAEQLTFTYPTGEAPALQDVSFHLQNGKMLGIAGATGSGKTTLLSLILKLYTPQKNTLFVGGRDVDQIPAATLRENAGYVPQDGFLFKQSIYENVCFFGNYSREEAQKYLEVAGMGADLAAMTDGLDTDCGERGTALSGGQRQRVALARALIRRPQLLLLDDTLSAVDAGTEERILQNLKQELTNRSCVVVAHRLSALKNADEILFLDHGRVIERGTHEQLLALNGEYARMYALQHKKEDA